MKKTAFYAGSFDPFTLGHLMHVAEAAGCFDKIIIAINNEPAGRIMFSATERAEMVKSTLDDLIRWHEFMSRCKPLVKSSGLAVLCDKMKADDGFIEISSYIDEPVAAAVAAKADTLILDPEENVLCSPYVRNISRHYGHPLEIWHRTPEKAMLPGNKCAASVEEIKHLCASGLFVIAAEYVAPSVLQKMTVPYLERLWLKERAWYGPSVHDKYRMLVNTYNAPKRFYHTMGHLACMFDWLRVYAVRNDEKFDRHNLSLAVFAHDLVNTGGEDDVARSLELMENYFSRINELEVIRRIAAATDHNRPLGKYAYLEEKLICDADLAILGADTSVYWQYAVGIRQEYAAVDDQEYAKGRTAFLQTLAARKHIFALPFFRQLLEENARKNIARELEFWLKS